MKVVTAEDAEDVVEIMKSSMMDTYSDEFGVVDFNRSQYGFKMIPNFTAIATSFISGAR